MRSCASVATKTGSDGRFVLRGLQATPLSLVVAAPGCVRKQVPLRRFRTGEQRKGLRMVMDRGACAPVARRVT